MDSSYYTRIVYDRIQMLEPEHVSKIIGYLLLQGNGEREMIKLACAPERLIVAVICKVKSDLGLNSALLVGECSSSNVNPIAVPEVSPQFQLYPPISASSPSTSGTKSFSNMQVVRENQPVNNLQGLPPWYAEQLSEDIFNQVQLLNLENHFGTAINSEFSGTFHRQDSTIDPRTRGRAPSFPECPVKVCHYFIKGYCKHGNNCRYLHPQPDNFFQTFGPCLRDLVPEERDVCQGSLERLEFELTELLRSRRGPVSIASLPMLYYEKYGRTLQADGYLTESQRHGKSGYSLTKLLSRLKNTIKVIDRPHGQHSVILVEDTGDRKGVLGSSANQIYLTFPAESTFTEQDVSNYFRKFGPVRDVRIPCQQKRMFGFVTFVFSESVKQILSTDTPHFVRDARVLVKPYLEKTKKHPERLQHFMNFNRGFVHEDAVIFSSMIATPSRSRFPLIRENERAHQAASEILPNPDQAERSALEQFDYLMDFLNSDSVNDDNDNESSGAA